LEDTRDKPDFSSSACSCYRIFEWSTKPSRFGILTAGSVCALSVWVSLMMPFR